MHIRQKLSTVVLFVLVCLLFLVSQSRAVDLAVPPEQDAVAPPVASELVFEAGPGPDTTTLQALVAGATTDEEAVGRVVNYFRENRGRLQLLWREDNQTRLAALYAMYIVHISHVYGETTMPTSLVEYMENPRSHCGPYSVAQGQIVDAMGLQWRLVGLSSGWHGWIEVMVDGEWELFDATTNVWINRSGLDLINQSPRQYRNFYTPLNDINRPDARWHLEEGYDMQRLRMNMPGLGIFYNPPGYIYLLDSSDGLVSHGLSEPHFWQQVPVQYPTPIPLLP